MDEEYDVIVLGTGLKVSGLLSWSRLLEMSRHFGPRTLRTQDISALVPKCP